MKTKITAVLLAALLLLVGLRLGRLWVSGTLSQTWSGVPLLSEVAVFILVANIAPTVLGLWTMISNDRSSRPPLGVGALTWAALQGMSLFLAIGLLFLGWYESMEGVDAAGAGWRTAWVEVRQAHASASLLSVVPMLGLAAWYRVTKSIQRAG